MSEAKEIALALASGGKTVLVEFLLKIRKLEGNDIGLLVNSLNNDPSFLRDLLLLAGRFPETTDLLGAFLNTAYSKSLITSLNEVIQELHCLA